MKILLPKRLAWTVGFLVIIQMTGFFYVLIESKKAIEEIMALKVANPATEPGSNLHHREISSAYLERQNQFIQWALVVASVSMVLIFGLLWRLMRQYRINLEKKIQSERLLENERAKSLVTAKLASLGEMAGGIAHEINNPLSIINGYAEMIDIKITSDEVDKVDVHRMIDKILATTHRISRIIRGLRNLSHNSSQDKFDSHCLAHVIQDTLDLCSERFRSHGITLRGDFGLADEIRIDCQRVELSQVFLNLLNNSFDAIKDLNEKWIQLDIILSQTHVTLSIIDSGPGIETNLRNEVMKPFFTTKPVGVGTGLGLSISQSIISSHRGSLKLDTNSPHTKFDIVLPLRHSQSPFTEEAA